MTAIGGKLRANNTSGFRGVSREKSTGKWAAYIRRAGERRFLGLYETPEEASAAYNRAAEELDADAPDRRGQLIKQARAIYQEHGPSALASSSLNAAGITEGKLKRVGLSHAGLLSELGLSAEYEAWRATSFTYAGITKVRWTWRRAVEVARDMIERDGDLPTVQECRLKGLSQLTNFIHRSGRTWEELRIAAGLKATMLKNGRPRYFDSRIGVRWRSRPEASLSNFLYARGIEHKRGERYPAEYEEHSGRAHGRYDLHFKSRSGVWIDVEIWGDIPDAYSHGRYRRIRALKEAWRAGDPNFLGLQYQDCLHDERLTKLLAPFIGVIAPFHFDKARDRQIETAHWTDADELLETCRELAAQMPDGVFPSDEWLRKRGRYADRSGPTYNTISQRVNTWIGGTRRVRELLGQAEASTTRWTPESVIEAWRRFQANYDLAPTQCKGASGKRLADPGVVAEGARIYEVARRLGVVEAARGGRIRRKAKWTVERVIAEWRNFEQEHGLSPSQAMGPIQRARLPREVTNNAARIYSAARRIGAVEAAKVAVGVE